MAPHTPQRSERPGEAEALLDAADLIALEGVGKRYRTASGDVDAVRDVSLRVAEGEFCTIIGPSGCGKSTLLGMLGGLVAPDTGQVLIAGRPVAGPDPRRAATVFQDPGLFPWRSALENIAFGLEIQGVAAARRRAAAHELLGPLGLRAFADKYPRELSGGMRQRVAIGRALAIDAPIILMDEPFGALDEQTRTLMGEWLLDIWRRTGRTVIFVTHSLHEALALSTRVVVMTARPGRIKSVVELPMPYPRAMESPELVTLRAKLWSEIRDESLRAMQP
ncbi:MAG: ABC transporter ATP-binding protein [Candidatus Rokubacteria bacterium]|nr:ABC transporter ATP-binding protein [Candidatus Rokubacteria bacterium]